MKVLLVDGARVLEQDVLLTKNVHTRYVTCGRPTCSCQLGRKHGPYYYVRKRVEGKYVDSYVKLKNRLPADFRYEVISNDLIIEVKWLSEIPQAFASCPAFEIMAKVR